jgi:hypothetical protein
MENEVGTGFLVNHKFTEGAEYRGTVFDSAFSVGSVVL